MIAAPPADPRHVGSGAPAGLRVAGRYREGIRELALVTLAALAYFGVRHLTEASARKAYADARLLLRLEHFAQLAWEVPLQRLVLPHPVLVTLADWVYIWGHWPVIVLTGILLFRYRRGRYVTMRNAMLLSGAIGFLFFAFFPVAPPRFAVPALVDTVTLHSHAYRGLQPPALTNEYASFPSLHFGWDLLAAIAVWGATRSRWLRALAVAGPAAMASAVVLTANHYVVDVVGGLVVVLVALAAVQLPSRRGSRGPRALHPAVHPISRWSAARRVRMMVSADEKERV